ncbi:MAG: isocitrate/isopropylmalate family dehydrogenase, partial [Candidatus Acidiferrales bacterium]
SAPGIAGKNIANPMGAGLAAGMRFEFFGWTAEAHAIESAVRSALREGKTPAELGGSLGTSECGDCLASLIAGAKLR